MLIVNLFDPYGAMFIFSPLRGEKGETFHPFWRVGGNVSPPLGALCGRRGPKQNITESWGDYFEDVDWSNVNKYVANRRSL